MARGLPLPRGAMAAALAVVAMLAAPAERADATTIETIVQDDGLLLHASDEEIRTAMARISELGIDRVRLTAGWSVIAPEADSAQRPDFDAADPAAYPAHLWANLDRAVRLSREAGLSPMIDIAFWAPRWATREPADRPDRLAAEIDPREYAKFALAVATRYSGSWKPAVGSSPAPAGDAASESPDRTLLDKLFGEPAPPSEPPAESGEQAPLPGVDLFTIWNEPNHPGFLRPQWARVDGRWVPRSPEIYRDMVRAAHPAIKAAAPGSRVLIGGTASMGSSRPGIRGVPPLRFLRALACVDERLEPVTTGSCANFERIPGDGWSHHPYSLDTTPDQDTRDRDKLPVAATSRLTATLRALVDAGRLDAKVADVYMTEYGYETNGPDPKAPFTPEQQGPLLARAEFIATSDPAVKSWPQFQLYDRPAAPPRAGMREFGDWQSGLYYADGSPKPAAATFATPAFASCVPRKRRWTLVWGRLRDRSAGSSVTVERRDASGAWRPVETFDSPSTRAVTARSSVAAGAGEAVRRYVRHRRGAAYRLSWSGRAGERTSAAVEPAATGCRARRAKPARSARRR